MKRLAVFFSLLVFIGELGSKEYTTRFTARAESSTLTNDYAPWSGKIVRIDLSKKRHFGVGFFEEQLRRYDLGDKRDGVSAWITLADRLTWSGEYTKAAEGIVIPKESRTNRLGITLFKGWQIAVAATDNEYDTGARSDITSAEVLTYTGPFRLAYTRYHAEVKNAGDAQSDKFTLHWFYDSGYTAAAYSKGRELEALPWNRVLVLDVVSFALFGEYRLDETWSIEYSYEYTEQDTLYLRNGVGLGAVYSF